jgi:hypothetical protein
MNKPTEYDLGQEDFFLGYEQKDFSDYPEPEEEYPNDDEEEEWKRLDDFAHFLRENNR